MQSTILDGTDLASLDADAWDRLAEGALCGNPFYGREHVLAGFDTIDGGALRALAVYRGESELVGLFPFRVRRIPQLLWPLAEGVTNRYQFSGIPLVAGSCARQVVACFLAFLTTRGGPDFWTVPHIDIDTPLAKMIAASCARRGLEMKVVGRYRRPRLTRMPGGLEEHVATAVPKRRRREIERSMRRLRESGTLAFERTDDPKLVPRRVEQFLELEHAGWKGRLGTSFLSSAENADFARAAYANAIVDSLLLDGKPIAISLNIACGRTLFTPKCAYDEKWRRYAPGLVLEHLAVEAFYADDRFDETDAATTVDGHVVGDFWNGSKQMGQLVVGPAGWRTALFAKSWQSLMDWRATARRLIPRRREAAARRPGSATAPVLAQARAKADRLAATMHRAGLSGLLFLGGAEMLRFVEEIKRYEMLISGLAL